jgi:hypothetical protein
LLRDRHIPKIYHAFDINNRLVEVHPSLDMTAEEIVVRCEATGCYLVLDLNHVRREYRPDEIVVDPKRQGKPSPFGLDIQGWKQAIKVMAPFISVIHVNPGDEAAENEALASTNPRLTITGQLLAYTLEQAGDHITHVVAEHRPILRKGGCERAERMLDVITRYLK